MDKLNLNYERILLVEDNVFIALMPESENEVLMHGWIRSEDENIMLDENESGDIFLRVTSNCSKVSMCNFMNEYFNKPEIAIKKLKRCINFIKFLGLI